MNISACRAAMITGASGGLGEGFARELARRGCALVVVGRDGDRLASLAEELAAASGVSTEVLVADLASATGLELVERRISGGSPPIDLLVNAAGALGAIGPIALQPATGPEELIRVGVVAPVRLTQAAVRRMVALGGGGVVNVASVTAFWPTPGGAVYSAVKAFMTSFSQSVHGEVVAHGVHVTAVCPGSVRTRLHESAGHRGGRMGGYLDPEHVVRAALSAVAAGHPVHVPGAEYRVKAAVARCAPRLARGHFYRRWGKPAAAAIAAWLSPPPPGPPQDTARAAADPAALDPGGSGHG
jgi:short-subunit dehydrogenase